MNDQFKNELIAIVGEQHLLLGKDDLEHYGQDWSKLYQPNPCAVVRPKDTEQVQTIVNWANENKVALVPSGGRTGLSGGACATNGELVVSLERLNQINNFNATEQTVTCGAGVITKQLQEFADDKGLFYPVDFASTGSSQIGGNIATNAGGIKVIRWGMTRDWVVGLTVVTGRGEVLRLNQGLVKNATGYDLRHLFIGSEGTLGFITEAEIKLTQKPKPLTVMVLGLQQLEDVYPVLNEMQHQLSLTAFEFFSDAALEKVKQHQSLQAPFETPCPFYVLLEYENENESIEQAAFAAFEHCVENEWVVDGVISQSDSQAEQLWALRERISESISHYTPYKNDISVTTSKVAEFLSAVDKVVKQEYPDFEIIWFGHIGDGNVHLNILRPDNLSIEQFVEKCRSVNPLIFAEIQKLNGSISAEHGVGLVKRDYLDYSRSTDEITLMQQIKQIFDPNNICNPGKVIGS